MRQLKELGILWHSGGIVSIAQAIYARVFDVQLRIYPKFAPYFKGKKGLEIGGPSFLFRKGREFPIYPIVGTLDNCDFDYETVWHGTLEAGKNFYFDPQHEAGMQYIGEAGDLVWVEDGTYDFLLTSHVLEHIANPIKALNEWKRVLVDDGVLVLCLPHKERTFDRYRPVTPLEHFLEDYRNDVGEDDLTHLEEVLQLHDFSLGPVDVSPEEYRKMAKENIRYRVLHHHVFVTPTALRLLDAARWQILAVEPFLPWHIFVIAQKKADEATIDNHKFLRHDAQYLRKTPFHLDKAMV